jgi:hypothetical protein
LRTSSSSSSSSCGTSYKYCYKCLN